MSSAATAILALLSFLNLALLTAVVRKLNLLVRRDAVVASPEVLDTAGLLPAIGSRPANVVAETTDGTRFSTDDLTGATLVGFFLSDCPPCKEIIPDFVTYARMFPGGRDNVLAVIATDDAWSEPTEFLAEVAQVIVEPLAGPVCRAFDVHSYPAVCLLNGPQVALSAFNLEPLLHNRSE